MIILQSPLSIRVELFLKRKFWKKVHYDVSKVVFSFSPSIFFYPFINILQENAKSRQKKILFHYKETFSRMSEHTSLQKQIKQVFSVALHFVFISWRHRSEDNRKKRNSVEKTPAPAFHSYKGQHNLSY